MKNEPTKPGDTNNPVDNNPGGKPGDRPGAKPPDVKPSPAQDSPEEFAKRMGLRDQEAEEMRHLAEGKGRGGKGHEHDPAGEACDKIVDKIAEATRKLIKAGMAGPAAGELACRIVGEHYKK